MISMSNQTSDTPTLRMCQTFDAGGQVSKTFYVSGGAVMLLWQEAFSWISTLSHFSLLSSCLSCFWPAKLVQTHWSLYRLNGHLCVFSVDCAETYAWFAEANALCGLNTAASAVLILAQCTWVYHLLTSARSLCLTCSHLSILWTPLFISLFLLSSLFPPFFVLFSSHLCT